MMNRPLALLLVAASLAAAESTPPPKTPVPGCTVTITNLAGHALSGELVDVKDDTVRLRLASGAVQSIPASALAPGEKNRLLRLLGEPAEPAPGEVAIQRDLALALARIDVREKEGEIDAETAAKLREEARATARFRARKSAR